MKRKIKWGIGFGTAGLLLAAIFCFTTWPRDILQRPLIVDATPHAVDVIVVLGAGTRRADPDRLPTQAKQRVLKGLELLSRDFSGRLILTGGRSPSTGLIEADMMARYAIANGLDDSQLLLERQARNTWENVEHTNAIMHENNWRTALVVTSPYHTWRACRMLRVQGVDAECVAASYALLPRRDTYNKFMDNRAVVREYGAIIWAWLQKEL